MVRSHDASHEYQAAYRDLVHAFFLRYPNPLATHVLSVDVLGRTIEKRHLSPLPQDGADASASSSSSSSSTTTPLRAPREQYVLRTTRLILKRGTLPSWAPRGIMKNAESWVLEESEVELEPYSLDAGKGGIEALQAAKRADDEEAARRLAGDGLSWTPPWDASKGKGKEKEPLMPQRGVRAREMRSWTRNLDHTNVMAVTESMRLHEVPSASSFLSGDASKRSSGASGNTGNARGRSQDEEGTTYAATTANITSTVALSLLARRIEKFGLNRYLAHVDTSRQGLTWTYTALLASRNPAPPTSSGNMLVPVQQAAKKARLYAALRPPFLDGDFQGPVARLRKRWEGVREWWNGLKRGGSAAIEERIRGLSIGQQQQQQRFGGGEKRDEDIDGGR